MKTYVRILLAISIAAQMPAPVYGDPANPALRSATNNIPDYIRSLLVSARTAQDHSDPSLEQQLEIEHLQRIKEMERDFLETAPDPAQVDSSQIPPREELNNMPIETFIHSDPKYLAGLFSRLMIFGRGRKLKEMFTRALKNLSVQGDSQDYTIRVSGSPVPNASIYPEKAMMIVNLGLIGMSSNEDELAYVIAHEMTHQNRALLEAGKDSEEIAKMLDQVNGYSGLEPAQREEIRADLGAIERLIKGGYNPWAGYDFMKSMAKSMQASWDLVIMKWLYHTIFKRDFSYMEAHPSNEIRMAAMKAYILARSREVDLADQTNGYHAYQGILKTLHLQMQLISRPLFSKWGQRSQQGLLGYELWSLFFSESRAAHILGIVFEPVGTVIGVAFQPVKWTFSKVGDLFSLLWKLAPDQVTQNMPSTGDVFAYGFLGMVGLGLSMLGLVAVSGIRNTFLHDQAYPTYTKIFADLKELKALSTNPETQESERLLKSMQTLNEISHGIQDIYSGSSFVDFTRRVNGISIVMVRSYYMYLSLIDQAGKYVASLPEIQRDDFILKVVNQMKDMPGYVFNFGQVRDSYLKFILASKGLHLEPATSSEEFLRTQKEADPIRAELSIMVTVRSINENTPADLRVNIAYELIKLGARDLAFEIIGEVPSLLIDKVLTNDNSDPQVTRKLQYLLTESKRGGSLRDTGYFTNIFKDMYLAGEKVRSRFTGRREAVFTLTRSVPAQNLFFSYIPLRAKLESIDAQSLQDKMVKEFNSLPEVVSHLDQEVVNKGGLVEVISPVLVDALAQRPDWIQSEQDVELILSRPELWPQFNGSISESSPLEMAFVIALKKLKDRFPSVWKFEPAAAEKVHKVIIARLRELKLFPQTLAGKVELWKKLTSRGVTTTTDNLFHEIYRESTGAQKDELEVLALNEGRVWETEIKAEIAQIRIFGSADFQTLLNSSDSNQRMTLVKKLVEETQRLVPEGGRVYWDLLEKLSVRITSNEAESKLIHDSKALTAGGEKQEDFGLRILSQLTEEALGWKRSDQWALIQFLRGKGPVTKKVQKAFNVIGPERVQRMFDLLPLLARTELIDAFIDAPRGLLGSFKVDSGWGKTILEEIFADKTSGEVEVAKEILEAFLHALKKTGNGALRTYVVSYLLAQNQGHSDTAMVLKNVLEIFGATGVKIGQFLAASGILPEKETAVLRSLQEQAKVPAREEIYSDVREVLGTESLPFRLGDLKGAASIKYAVEVFDGEVQKKAILKVFRLESIAHTRMEFGLLDKMADFLVARHGTKYGIFRSVVRASRAAVERELVVPDEIKKSLAAQRYIYVNLDEAHISVKAPFEALIANRAIISEYAEGGSFFSLRDDIKPIVAKKILTMEGQNLFSNKPVILFDPDRHAGNYRIHVQSYNGQNHLVLEEIDVSAIDMGQLLKLKPDDRERIVELFAISQVLKEVGPNIQLAVRLTKMFGLSEKQQQKLMRQLAMYYPDKAGKEITAYFALLASLESVGIGIDIAYFDFVRSIIQLQQYEPFVPTDRDWQTPSEIFAAQVKAHVSSIIPDLQLNVTEKLSYAWENLQGGFFDKIKTLGGIVFSAQKRSEFKSKLESGKPQLPKATCEQLLEGRVSPSH